MQGSYSSAATDVLLILCLLKKMHYILFVYMAKRIRFQL